MTDHSDAIRRLHQRAYTVLTGFSADLPAYDSAPSALVETGLVHGIRRNIDLYFRFLATGSMPTTEELAPLIELAIERHRDGVAVDDILATYQAGSTLIWDHVAADLADDRSGLLAECARALVRYLMTVTGQIALACGTTHDVAATWSTVDARRAMAIALLTAAEPPPGTVARIGPVAARYRVAVFRPAPTGDPGVLRDVRARTSGIAGALGVADSAGWTVLVPDGCGRDTEPALAELRNAASLPEAGGGPTFWAGVSDPAAPGTVPGAHAEAQSLVATAQTVGHADRVTTGRDVLFAHIVASAHAAHPHLQHVVDSLAAESTARETLWTFLDQRCNRGATADALHIHRNTVAYRLSRIASLTGFDPQDPSGAQVLAAVRVYARSIGTGSDLPGNPQPGLLPS